MPTVPYRPDEINLPDVYNFEDVDAFVRHLDHQQYRYGVKKLSKCFLAIRSHLDRINKHKNEAERLINIVNGTPTESQQRYYTEKKLRSAAFRFYNTLTMQALGAHLAAIGLSAFDCEGREEMIELLVNAHVQRESERGE